MKLDDKTQFVGYETLASDAPVVALLDEAGRRVQALDKGAKGTVVLERTPFYAESGGQVGDTGELSAGAARFAVSDTQKNGAAFGHQGTVTAGRIAVGDRVNAQVDEKRRAAIVLNHSATHLAARGAAQSARRARAAEGLARRAEPACASTSRTSSP